MDNVAEDGGWKHLTSVDEVPQPFQRLDWGEEVQFYVLSHRWDAASMHIMSDLRVTHWLNQSTFIQALVTAGMPTSEAQYLNKLLEEEGIRRRQDPQTFPFIECLPYGYN